MTAEDELALFTNSAAETAEAQANRPPFRTSPIEFEGTWGGEVGTQERYTPNGTEIAEWAFKLDDCKFIHVDPKQLGQYHDGDTYYLTVAKPKPGGRFANTEFGMMQKSAGVESFAELKGSRLHFTEDARKPWPTAERPTYYYKVAKVGGNGSVPAAKPAEPTEAGVAAALELLRGGTVERDTGVLLGTPWTEAGFKYMAAKTPSINADTVLLGKIADGSWLKSLISVGDVINGADGLVLVS